MRIDSSDKILGISIFEIRKLLRKGRDGVWDVDYVQHVLGIPDEQASSLLVELEKQGLIVPNPLNEVKGWINTLKGNSLALARANKPLSRKAADRIIIELKERITKVNSDPYFLFKVNKVVLFGSYLTNSITMNDIDVAIELLPKETDSERHMQLCEQRSQFLADNGKRFDTYVAYLVAAEREVYTALKARSRYLSFHSIDDKILKTAKQKLVEIN